MPEELIQSKGELKRTTKTYDPDQARTGDFGVATPKVLAPHSNQLSYEVISCDADSRT